MKVPVVRHEGRDVSGLMEALLGGDFQHAVGAGQPQDAQIVWAELYRVLDKLLGQAGRVACTQDGLADPLKRREVAIPRFGGRRSALKLPGKPSQVDARAVPLLDLATQEPGDVSNEDLDKPEADEVEQVPSGAGDERISGSDKKVIEGQRAKQACEQAWLPPSVPCTQGYRNHEECSR